MSFFTKLRDRLTKSSSKIGGGLDDIVAAREGKGGLGFGANLSVRREEGDLLRQVSRSFYLSLAVLPRGLRMTL